jgi:hypothetical protein
MLVLVACEFSGIVRDAFAARGHDAMSCDLLPTEVPGLHYQGDVLPLLKEGWDLIIAHPPCTYLANSGVRWLHDNSARQEDMRQAAKLFNAMFDHGAKLCVENPVMHRYAKELIPYGHTQIVQPWQFGHGETKATCLWLRGLPKLVPTNIVDGRVARVHRAAPSKDRWKERSITYTGIARAMAEQWG